MVAIRTCVGVTGLVALTATALATWVAEVRAPGTHAPAEPIARSRARCDITEEELAAYRTRIEKHVLRDTVRRVYAKLRGAPERTTTVGESDWSRAYEGTHTGPIETWTSMDHVNVPSLDRRLFSRVRPLCTDRLDAGNELFVVIDVRATVDSDYQAALADALRSPDVEWAHLGGHSVEQARSELCNRQ